MYISIVITMKNNIFLHNIFYCNAYFYPLLGLYLPYLGFLAYSPLLKFTQYKKCFPMIYYKSDFDRKEKNAIELGKGYICTKNPIELGKGYIWAKNPYRTGKEVHLGQKWEFPNVGFLQTFDMFFRIIQTIHLNKNIFSCNFFTVQY